MGYKLRHYSICQKHCVRICVQKYIVVCIFGKTESYWWNRLVGLEWSEFALNVVRPFRAVSANSRLQARKDIEENVLRNWSKPTNWNSPQVFWMDITLDSDARFSVTFWASATKHVCLSMTPPVYACCVYFDGRSCYGSSRYLWMYDYVFRV